MADPAEMEDLSFEFEMMAAPLRPRTRDELVQMLIQLQFAADRLGTVARRALIMAHGLAGDEEPDGKASVIHCR